MADNIPKLTKMEHRMFDLKNNSVISSRTEKY